MKCWVHPLVWLWKMCWLVELLLLYFMGEKGQWWSTRLEVALLSLSRPLLWSV